MSAGQIVASGTSLELKKKFGSGYTLSIIAKSAEDSAKFTELYDKFRKDRCHVDSIQLLDQSGALSSYSISNKAEDDLKNSITLIEELIRQRTLLDDFCLERTSMDEVFVKLGKMFQLENGAEQEICDV
jgi:ABC-type multidrug transport system ATPase subunit